MARKHITQLTQSEAIERMSNKNQNLDYSMFQYINSKTPSKVICKLCGAVFETDYASIIQQNRRCKCQHKLSSYQKSILNKSNIL